MAVGDKLLLDSDVTDKLLLDNDLSDVLLLEEGAASSFEPQFAVHANTIIQPGLR